VTQFDWEYRLLASCSLALAAGALRPPFRDVAAAKALDMQVQMSEKI
jgi:hypothetical protein